MPSSKNYVRDYETASCAVCSKEFIKRTYHNRFCSESCKGRWKYINRDVTTESQYKLISGNWDRYLSRLLAAGGKKRNLLTREVLLEKLEEQNYRCALSGIPLTCNLEKGVRFPFNASVDRILAGGPYTKDNIQLVCKSINSFRVDTSISDFIAICTAVADFNREKRVAK
ncbi:hypothetical protein EKK58_08200 [Candidatus Dependentiae bacterium]|nr:MAG: hypothetical protein EKK58_08200 [Candidatus Dependentiae bacterium]